jgi:hypothetical protein
MSDPTSEYSMPPVTVRIVLICKACGWDYVGTFTEATDAKAIPTTCGGCGGRICTDDVERARWPHQRKRRELRRASGGWSIDKDNDWLGRTHGPPKVTIRFFPQFD